MAIELLGSINVDVIQSVAALPRPGETVLSHATARMPGGKGANQAVAAARLGAQVAMLGAVGADAAGAWMLDLLAGEGIDTRGIARRAEVPTGIAYIAVDAGGENQIIVAPGANATLDAGATIASPRAGVLLAQLEVPLPAVAAFLKGVARPDRIRLLNAAPALPEARALFGDVDLLIVNQHELGFYTGEAPPGDAQAALSARKLLTRAGQAVVVTLGAGGAVLVTQETSFHAPGRRVTPVDTVGAGDCFVGALAARLDAGDPIEAALPFANAAAALSTQRPGAAPSMPSRAEVRAMLACAPT